MPIDPSQIQIYYEQGFVVIPSLIPSSLLPSLRAASERAIARTRSGRWSHRRTVGRQFPPYGQDNPDSWGVQHVMHPDLGEKAFAQWYTSDALTGAVRDLLGCEEDQLQMGESEILASQDTLSLSTISRTVQYVDQSRDEQVCFKMASR